MFSFFGGIFLIPEIVQQNHATPGAKLHVCQNRSEWMTYAIGHVIVHFFFLSSTFISNVLFSKKKTVKAFNDVMISLGC